MKHQKQGDNDQKRTTSRDIVLANDDLMGLVNAFADGRERSVWKGVDKTFLARFNLISMSDWLKALERQRQIYHDGLRVAKAAEFDRWYKGIWTNVKWNPNCLCSACGLLHDYHMCICVSESPPPTPQDCETCGGMCKCHTYVPEKKDCITCTAECTERSLDVRLSFVAKSEAIALFKVRHLRPTRTP